MYSISQFNITSIEFGDSIQFDESSASIQFKLPTHYARAHVSTKKPGQAT